MADTRLVVTDRDPAGEETVEVVHESLIRGWGRLRGWMSEDRRFRTWQERLRAALRQWETSQHDTGALLRGVPLAEAEDWLAERETDLSQAERQFIQASLELREQEEAEKEEQHRRELEAAQKLAEEAKARQAAEEQARKEAEQRAEEQIRATNRLCWWVRGVVLVLLVAVGAGLFAWYQQLTAEEAVYNAEEAKFRAEQKRDEAEKVKEEAERQARIAQARQLAVQAQNVLETYPQRSLLLAVEALNITVRKGEPRVPAAEQVLRDALTRTGGIGLSSNKIAISPDNHWLVTGSRNGTVRLWDLTAADPAAAPLILRGHDGHITSVAFSPDRRWFVTGSNDDTARLWTLRLDELIDLACQTVGRNLSYTEWDQYFRGEEYRLPCAELSIHPDVIKKARDFAESGDIEGATSIFQRAVELDSSLDFDPKTEAHKWRAKGLREQGNTLAEKGKIEEAIATYEEAKTLDPSLTLDPQAEANKWAHQGLTEKGRR